MQKIAAAYIRVSTDDQIEYSPDSQLKAIKSYAEKNNLILAEEFIFIDEGISGKNTKKRTEFNKMIGLAKTKPKPFDTILLWKFSRFARNREDSVVYKSMLRKQLGIDVISISENIGDDKMSILFEAMIEAMDEYYSINLAEEVKRGMTEKARRGGVVAIPAFGYTVEDDKFKIVEEEAEIIKKVFYDYTYKNKGFLTLAKELNSLGIKTHRGKPIESRTIEYWLNNPIYIGKVRWNPKGKTHRNYHCKDLIIEDGQHAPIISKELWNATQDKMKIQKQKYYKNYTGERKDLSHWLTGIIRCEKCGATLSLVNGFYSCSKKGKALCTGNGYLSVKKIEKIVLDTLKDITMDNKIVKVEPVNKIETDEDEYELFELQIERAKQKLVRLKESYENGVDTLQEYKESKTKVLNEIENLENTLKEKKVENTQSCEINKKQIKNIYEILQDNKIKNTEKNKLLRQIIKEITKGGKDGKEINIVFWGE